MTEEEAKKKEHSNPYGNVVLEFDRADVLTLRKLYDVAVRSGVGLITYRGQQLLTSYTKYLLEYLEGRLGMTRKEVGKDEQGVDEEGRV